MCKLPGHGIFFTVMSAIALAALHPATASAQRESVRPGVNKQFRDPQLNVQQWVERFEGESREVFDKRKQIVAALDLKPGMVVADIGAGTGLLTRLMAQTVGETGKVYAVDIAAKFLDYVRDSAKKLNLPQIQTVLGKDDSVELPAAAIELAFICDTYHHFEYPEKIMRSLYTALAPQGRVVIIDFIRKPGVSSDWVLEHVRAGQEVVEAEVSACGFRKIGEVPGILKENYIIVFEKSGSTP